jgi:hypothetical protein
MRHLICVLTVFLSVALAAQVGDRPAADFLAAAHLFDYDQGQPLDIHDKIVEEFDGGALHDITYTSPKGGPVSAYLVVPKGKGPFAAVLFGHWGNGTRAEFIPEAKIYARAGAVSLIPDYPSDRPPPWHKTPDHFDKPEVDREIEIQAVIDLRRGIDLLLARPDVDPKRLAYIEHSYGAQWGSILSAVDKRMKTSVLMAGVAEMADILLRSDDPGMVDFRKTQPAGQLENSRRSPATSTPSTSSERRRPFLCCSNSRTTSSTSTRLQWSTTLLPRANQRRCCTTILDTI